MSTTEELIERYRRAWVYFDAKDYAESVRLLDPVVEAEPGNLDARLLLARAAYHSAQLNRAEGQLRLILEQDPSESYAHLLLGRTLQRMNREPEATGHLRLAAALTGQNIDAPRRLAPAEE